MLRYTVQLFLITILLLTVHTFPAKADTDLVTMSAFNGMDIRELVEYISDVTGYSIIIDPSVRGKISIATREQITVRESIELLRSLLQNIGYTFETRGDILEVVKLKDVSGLSGLYTNINDLKAGLTSAEKYRVITYIKPLRNAKGDRLINNLKKFQSKYGSIVYDDKTGKVIITDIAENIIQLDKLIDELDVAESADEFTVETVILSNLSYEQAVKIAEAGVNRITVSSSLYPAARRVSPYKSSGEMEPPTVKMVHVDFINSVILSGERNAVREVRELITSFDARFQKEKSTLNHEIIRLRGISATQVIDFLNRLIRGTSPQTRVTRPGESAPRKTGLLLKNEVEFFMFEKVENILVVIGEEEDRAKIKEIIVDLTRTVGETVRTEDGTVVVSSPGARSIQFFAISHVTSAYVIKILDQLKEKNMFRPPVPGQQPLTPQSEEILDGTVEFIDNPEANTVIVKAAESKMHYISGLIQNIDQRRTQVLIEVRIMEVAYERSHRIGIDYDDLSLRRILTRVVDTALISAGGWQNLAVRGIFNGISAASANAENPGVFVSTGDNRVIMNLLSRYGQVNIISTPNLLTLDNKTATLDSSEKKAIQKEKLILGNTENTADRVLLTHEYKDAGIKLNITPQINADGNVNLEIDLTVDDFKASTSAGFPDISSRKIKSVIILKDKSTAILGGIIKDKESDNVTGIPGLSRVPVLRRLFGKTVRETVKSEMIIFLTPHVIKNDEELEELSRNRILNSLVKSLPVEKRLTLRERIAQRKAQKNETQTNTEEK